MRQHGPRDPDETEDIGLKDAQDFLVRSFLYRSKQSVPSIVDEYIDTTEAFDGGVHRGCDLSGITQVE